MLTGTTEFEGKRYSVEWFSGVPVPSGERATQVSSICFTDSGQIVLVSGDGASWGLPGGHPEPGESVEEALRREVSEESCCEVERCEYLGYQSCTPEDGGEPDIQLRYACLVTPMIFNPKHEIAHRRIVSPNDFLKILAWGDSPIAAELARLSSESMKRFLAASQ